MNLNVISQLEIETRDLLEVKDVQRPTILEIMGRGPQGPSNIVFDGILFTPVTVYNDTQLAEDNLAIFADASAGPFTIFLPPAVGEGQFYIIQKIDATPNMVAIQAFDTDVINAATAVYLGWQFADGMFLDGRPGYWANIGQGASVEPEKIRETPMGAIDGVNTIFTLSNIPTFESEEIFWNGQLLDTADYTMSGATITLSFAPPGGKLTAIYWI